MKYNYQYSGRNEEYFGPIEESYDIKKKKLKSMFNNNNSDLFITNRKIKLRQKEKKQNRKPVSRFKSTHCRYKLSVTLYTESGTIPNLYNTH